ncbi:MAG: F0F1 ATP synthase subunit epsilon [Lachnospiraceae bacterium]|nr:F0F1 ATP synthase subunit epsilon [Lachnospiraceae bacterium]
MQGEHIFQLKIYAEEGVFYRGDAIELILPCADGEKAFLAHHETSVYSVSNGEMRFRVPVLKEGQTGDEDKVTDEWQEAVIGSGVVYFSDNTCTVLAETCERPDEIDENRARRALERAQERMQKQLSMREYRVSQMAMARAMARIRAVDHKKELG